MKEYVMGLDFDERALVLKGEIDGKEMHCFLRPLRRKVVVDTGQAEDGDDKTDVFDLAEVLYAGIKALENCR